MIATVVIMLFRYISYLLHLVTFTVSHNIFLRLLNQIHMLVYVNVSPLFFEINYIIIAVHLVDFIVIIK